MRVLRFISFLLFAVLIFPGLAEPVENQIETIDFWRRNYEEMRPENDVRAKRAHEIFTRLVNTAGGRPGVVPRLFISKSEPRNISLPIAIPDGSVIISGRTLDICSRDTKAADDRLAFVLGHELAHLLKDDFWHVKFFNAIKAAEAEKRSDAKTLAELREIAGSTDQVLAKELQADEFGIVYASMAGFNTRAVVDDDKVNFFIEWLQAVDPTYSDNAPRDPDHPTPEQRAETIKARLRQVLKNVEIFELGVAFYRTGQFERAISAFQRFLTYFPSREVYHNLAASHHQLAVKYYGGKAGGEVPLFRMSVAIDPRTRAAEIAPRGAEDAEYLFGKHLKEAIELYQRAIQQDPGYVRSYNNLACALILRGEEGDAYRAIAMLKDSLKIEPGGKDALNSLGVAFFYAENPEKAKSCFLDARKIDPAYDLPLFNLGRLALEQGNEGECKKFWSEYIEMDKKSPWAAVAKKFLGIESPEAPSSRAGVREREKVLGLETGAYDEEVPKDWGSPRTEIAPLERYPYKLNSFANNVMTVSQNKEIKLILAFRDFSGKTGRDVGMGCSKEDVVARYGEPDKDLESQAGFTLVYESSGIAFNFQERKVVSWILF
ncbi:MAG: tetratricopeptide repeat protein [Syntrophobacteraceae bacterium]